MRTSSAEPLQARPSLADIRLVFLSRFMPCADCGHSLEHTERPSHVCERERWLDYQLFQLQDELAAFDAQLDAYLASPTGRFETWYAARRRAPGRPPA